MPTEQNMGRITTQRTFSKDINSTLWVWEQFINMSLPVDWILQTLEVVRDFWEVIYGQESMNFYRPGGNLFMLFLGLTCFSLEDITSTVASTLSASFFKLSSSHYISTHFPQCVFLQYNSEARCASKLANMIAFELQILHSAVDCHLQSRPLTTVFNKLLSKWVATSG